MDGCIVTTSWNDGSIEDLRVAELLAAHNLKGTFYVACDHDGRPALDSRELRELRAGGFEIGSHTVHHRPLTHMDITQAKWELTEGRRILEDILGAPVVSFAYPQGFFNRPLRDLVKNTGYRCARTSMAFLSQPVFDPFRMPVSLQFCRASRVDHLRHALRDASFHGVWNWVTRTGCMENLERLAMRLFEDAARHGGIFHVWARARDIHEQKLWQPLQDLFAAIGSYSGARRMTNLEVVEAVTPQSTTAAVR